MSRVLILGLASVILFAPTPSEAEVAPPAFLAHAFDEGRFAEAAAKGKSLDTAASLALAARALLVDAIYLAPLEERLARVEAAEALARRALEKNEAEIEAHIQIVVAIGIEAMLTGPIRAHFRGRPSEARRHIDRALALDPRNSWAHALLGAWHAEIVHHAGGFLARLFYGARRDEAMKRFAEAAGLDPDNLLIHVEHAKALLLLDHERYEGAARRALSDALALEAGTALERLARDQAVRIAEALDAGDETAVARETGRIGGR